MVHKSVNKLAHVNNHYYFKLEQQKLHHTPQTAFFRCLFVLLVLFLTLKYFSLFYFHTYEYHCNKYQYHYQSSADTVDNDVVKSFEWVLISSIWKGMAYAQADSLFRNRLDCMFTLILYYSHGPSVSVGQAGPQLFPSTRFLENRIQ